MPSSLLSSLTGLTCRLGAIAIVLGVTACSPTLNTRGNFLEPERVTGLEKGVTRQADVEKTLGSPTVIDPFDKNTWFYIGEKTKTTSFFQPEVQARRVVKVQFDDNGVLKDVAEVDEKSAKDVAAVDKTTAAPGGQSMNVFQQFLSNLGKFNTEQMNGTTPGR